MTREEARHYLSVPSSTNGSGRCTDEQHYEAKQIAIKALEQEPCDDVVSRQAIMKLKRHNLVEGQFVSLYDIEQLPPVRPQEQTGHYEKHIDHTDCIWYGSDSGCPVTCSQYRDGWNDAMDYIFKNGKGYQPYRHDG